MNYLVYATNEWSYWLTTASSSSSYGIPVLQVEGREAANVPVYGPGDIILIEGQNVLAGALVGLWGMHRDRTGEERKAASLYCQQWPDGMQVKGGDIWAVALLRRLIEESFPKKV